MRSIQSTFNLFAVSALLRETALNTAQTLSHGMLCTRASMARYDRRRESNIDEATGFEEADSLYDLGGLLNMDLNFSKMQAQHAAFVLAFALGSVSTAAWGTGYKHTITPIAGDLDSARSNPSFTLGMRWGRWLLKDRFSGNLIDSFKMSFRKDSWAELSAVVKGTGRRDTTVFSEDVTSPYNATSLTLAANAVAGSTATERLDNIHQVKVQVPTTLEWVDVVVTAVSGATPAVLTIVAPGGNATSTTYRVLYNRAETGAFSWGAFPSRTLEPPLRVSDLVINVGGRWNGSVIAGGHPMSAEIREIVWDFSNGLNCEFVPGGTGSFANRALRSGRTQKITIDRDFRDYIISRYLDSNETFVVKATATGPEFETGKNFYVDIVFPRVGVMQAPYSEEDKRLKETGDLIVLEDSTYGSVWSQVGNRVATYAA